MPRFRWTRERGSRAELADRARDARQWALAARLYREALDRDPDNPSIWVQYGHALKEWGQLRDPAKLAKAETAYRRALSLAPGIADSYLQLGHVLKLQGKADEARAAYLRAVALDGSAPEPLRELNGLGWSKAQATELRTLTRLEDAPPAANVDTVSLADMPQNRRTIPDWGSSTRAGRKASVIMLADRARDQRQWERAARLYRTALERNPRNPPIWVQYGHALKEAGKLAEAEAAYRKALLLEPGVAEPYLQLGHVLKLQGKAEGAQAAYLRAFALEPSMPQPLHELGGLGWSAAHIAEFRGLAAAAPKLALPGPAAASLSAVSQPLAETPEELNGSALERREGDIRAIRESGLFDETYYRAGNPDLPAGLDAVSHFVEFGAREGRMPNPLFDPKFYLAHNPALAQSGDNPLIHFIRRGAGEGQRPHPDFDPAFYLQQYPDVAPSGQNPLLHYFLHGKLEGRKRNATEQSNKGSVPVTDAEICCLKPPSYSDEVALFVTHSPDGRLKPHVPHYLDSLKRHGIGVILIVAADRPIAVAAAKIIAQLDGVFVRQNEGYDFAAWAHILHLHPQLFDSKILYLLNDSLIGPTNDTAFGNLLRRIRDSSADVIGLTDNHERAWHFQSYFLALKPRALASVSLHKFIDEIVSYNDKDDVIDELEIRFVPFLKAAGLNCEQMFSSADCRNPTLYHWKHLLQSGFPFIKVMAIRDIIAGVDNSDWREQLAAQGYDVALAERTLADAKAPARKSAPLRAARKGLVAPPVSRTITSDAKVAFIGPWNYNNGLGVASRGYVSALRHTGFPVNLHPVKKPFHIHQPLGPAVDICDFSGPADVAIIHLNPDGWTGLLTEAEMAIVERATMRLGVWVWEMAHIPKDWYPAFDRVDAIWAPSRYCAEIFATTATAPVAVVPHVVPADSSIADPVRAAALRRKLDVPDDGRIILYALDGSSYLVRKNPFALMKAFDRSGLAEKGWQLVLKTKHLFDSPIQGALLQQEASRARGVTLIDRSVDRATMHELMRAADIFASPHCSEGFGLGIAEAMAMGKIVVATDYGGSRDFLDSECGFPVRYRLQSLDRDHGHYTRGGVWAQVDEAHLAESLIEASNLVIAGDLRIGKAARQRVTDRLSPAAVAATMRENLNRIWSVV